MIVLDIETSGLDPIGNSLLSIGAIDYNSGLEFYGECYAEDWKDINPKALEVNGFTEEQARDKSKMMDERLYFLFEKWVKDNKLEPLLAGQQIGSFDILFLHEVAGGKSVFEQTFSKRSVDLHSVAFAAFGESLSLDGILKKLGLQPEPKPHNALTGARLELIALKILLNKTRII